MFDSPGSYSENCFFANKTEVVMMDREAVIKLGDSLIAELNNAKEKLAKVELSTADMVSACKVGVETIEKIVDEMENDLIKCEKNLMAL